MPRSDYPATVAEVLDPAMKFKPGVLTAVRRAARTKLWQGTVEERKSKFQALHADLCRVYGKTTKLEFGALDGSDSGASHYCPATDTITLCGRLSVITALHEFSHCLGRDEFGAVKWSVGLFARCFPKSWSRTICEGHMVRQLPF